MQLISDTSLFHNLYELSFTGIDQNRERICIYVHSHIIIYLFYIYILYDPFLICLINTLIPIICDQLHYEGINHKNSVGITC